jgi:hypothetical protein
MKPFTVQEFDEVNAQHKLIYEEQISGFHKAIAGKVDRRVALALLTATLKKVAAEKFHPKPGNSESAEEKIIREFKIERMVFGLLLSAKIIKMD